MILNMVGANQVQIVDFTLSEDVNLGTDEGLEIDNVYLPNGTCSEFAIWPISYLDRTNGTITHIYSPTNIANVNQSGLFLIYYSTVNGYTVLNDTGSIFVTYDATNHKLKIRCSLSSTFMLAEDYRLVIW